MARYLARAAFYLALVLLWEGLFRLHLWPPYLFPSPVQVLETLARGFQDRTMLFGMAISLKRIALGYGVATFLGIALGVSLGASRWLEETVGPLVMGLQALPSICWLPLALLWFGLNEKAIIFVVVIGALFSITIATQSGIRQVPPIYVHAARTMGAGGLRLFREIMIPGALPSIVIGMKQGWSFAWRSLMAGELLFVSLGLGHLLMMGRELNDMSQVLAVMVVIVAIGLVVDRAIFGPVERGIRQRWGMEKA